MHLELSKSCGENWANMTSTEQNCRFCAVCSREVVDFSKMSDEKILQFIRQNPEKTCGRFHPKQLNRTLYTPRLGKRTGLMAIAASLATVLSAQQIDKAVAPSIGSDTALHGDNEPQRNDSDRSKQDSLREISGKILDEFYEPLIGASIRVQGTHYGAVADYSGRFLLKVPVDTLRQHPLVLQADFIGYKSATLVMPDKIYDENLSFEMNLKVALTAEEAKMFVLGGYTVIKHPRIHRFKNIIRSIFNK